MHVPGAPPPSHASYGPLPWTSSPCSLSRVQMPVCPVSLRPYQREAVAAVIAARRRGVRRMVVSLPTGAGKTVIFSELAKMARRQVLVLAHREELLGQARAKLEAALEGRHVVSIERGRRLPLPMQRCLYARFVRSTRNVWPG